MQARCPQCQTLFNITQRHLNMANGRVRCNQCKTVFDGYTALVDNPPEESSQPAILEDKFKLDLAKGKGNKVDITPELTSKPNKLIYGELLEDDYNKPRKFETLKLVFADLIFIVLILLLVVQVAYYKREVLSKNPYIGKYVQKICRDIPSCEIPVQRELGAFKLDRRQIYSHPNIKKALVVSATFSNNASFSQPLPIIVLSMSNIRGQEVASRRFNPSEYLAPKTLNSLPSKNLGSGQNITINLQVADPGSDALAFEIDFL